MSKSDSTVKVQQPSNQLNDTAEDGATNIIMVQNVLLIWLDDSIDNQNVNCRHTITQLRSTINTTMTFTDPDECVDFLTNISDENVCMIISAALSQHLVPFIHPIAHLQSIFILCGNKTQLEQWAQNWPKVKGVFTDVNLIGEALKQTAHDCEQNSVPISIISDDGDIPKKKLDQLDPSFMYTQIIKEILFTITFDQKQKTQFFDYCRQQFHGNDKQLNFAKDLEANYNDKTPIWWYTCESFLYGMVNRALRKMDPDLIIKTGFFIVDLHRQIKQLHKQQFGSTNLSTNLKLYRGQEMTKTDFENVTKFKGGLLSFNCFLSTSKNRNISLPFVNRALRDLDMIGVIFVMIIDPVESTTPFASITGASALGHKEDEVLFSMHTVFRIGDIRPMNENHRLYEVELMITSKSDHDLRQLMDHIRKETFPESSGWYRLSLILS